MPDSHQGVGQSRQDPFGSPAVDVRVSSVEVAKGLRDPVRALFENEPFVAVPTFFQGHRESEFERHVESGRWGRPPIHSDPTEVVERVPAPAKKTDNPVQPPSASRDFDSRSRNEAEGAEPSDEGKVHRPVTPVVGNVDERVVTSQPRCSASRPASSRHQSGGIGRREELDRAQISGREALTRGTPGKPGSVPRSDLLLGSRCSASPRPNGDKGRHRNAAVASYRTHQPFELVNATRRYAKLRRGSLHRRNGSRDYRPAHVQMILARSRWGQSSRAIARGFTSGSPSPPRDRDPAEHLPSDEVVEVLLDLERGARALELRPGTVGTPLLVEELRFAGRGHPRISSRTASIAAWILPLLATRAGASRSSAPPVRFVTRPPASSTSRLPAAASHGPSLSSQ